MLAHGPAMADARRNGIRVAIGVAVVLALLLIGLPSGQRVPVDQRLTTLRTSPDGAGALYDLFVELGIPVERRMTALDGSAPGGDALALLAPTEPLTPAEQDSLIAWVRRGGTLIWVPAYRDPLLERLAVERDFAGPTGRATRAVEHPLTEGVRSIGETRFTLDPRSSPITAVEPLVRTTGDGIVVLRGRLEDGSVLLVSEPELLSNARIGGGLATILARVGAEATTPGSPLVFDEYHHGHRGGTPSQAFFSFLFGSPPGWLLLQLLAVATLALLPAAIRLGSPVAAITPPRRSPLEHVAALGEVYRQARAEEVARRRLLVGFARRLRRERPPAGGEAAFLDRIGRGAPAAAETVSNVARAWEERRPVAELARRIDDALERLNRTA